MLQLPYHEKQLYHKRMVIWCAISRKNYLSSFFQYTITAEQFRIFCSSSFHSWKRKINTAGSTMTVQHLATHIQLLTLLNNSLVIALLVVAYEHKELHIWLTQSFFFVVTSRKKPPATNHEHLNNWGSILNNLYISSHKL